MTCADAVSTVAYVGVRQAWMTHLLPGVHAGCSGWTGRITMARVQEGRSSLWELYTEITTLSGWSMRDVAERSTRLGAPGVSKSRVGQLVNANPLESISRDNIVSLADGLGVTAERVALAAVQSMGFRIADAGITPAEAIGRDPFLSEDTRSALLSILRTAEERRRPA